MVSNVEKKEVDAHQNEAIIMTIKTEITRIYLLHSATKFPVFVFIFYYFDVIQNNKFCDIITLHAACALALCVILKFNTHELCMFIYYCSVPAMHRCLARLAFQLLCDQQLRPNVWKKKQTKRTTKNKCRQRHLVNGHHKSYFALKTSQTLNASTWLWAMEPFVLFCCCCCCSCLTIAKNTNAYR